MVGLGNDVGYAPHAAVQAAKKHRPCGSGGTASRKAKQRGCLENIASARGLSAAEGKGAHAKLKAARLFAALPRRRRAGAVLFPECDPRELRASKDVPDGKAMDVIDGADKGELAAWIDLNSRDEAASGFPAGVLQIDGNAVDAGGVGPREFGIRGERWVAFIIAGIGDSASTGQSDGAAVWLEKWRPKHGMLLPLYELIGAEQIVDGFAHPHDGLAEAQREFAPEDQAEGAEAHGKAQRALAPVGVQRRRPRAHTGFSMENRAICNLFVGRHAKDAEAEAVAGDAAERLSHRCGAEDGFIVLGAEERWIAGLPPGKPEGIDRSCAEEVKVGNLAAAGQVREFDQVVSQDAGSAALPVTAPSLDRA